MRLLGFFYKFIRYKDRAGASRINLHFNRYLVQMNDESIADQNKGHLVTLAQQVISLALKLCIETCPHFYVLRYAERPYLARSIPSWSSPSSSSSCCGSQFLQMCTHTRILTYRVGGLSNVDHPEAGSLVPFISFWASF